MEDPMSRVVLRVLGLVALGACAADPKSTQRLAESMAAVRGAETAGASQVPEAALHLKLAEEQISEAQKVMDDDEERGNALALRAYNDADLALALTREAQSKQKAASFAEAHPNASPSGAQNPQSSQPQTVSP
jgi:pyridoxal biosynthesis lyase PdxS